MSDDLFSRDEEAEAVQALASARLKRTKAMLAVCGAPRAKLQECRRDLVTATSDLITAEQALAEIRAHRRVRY